MTLVGLVGVGRIGAFHAATLHALPGVEVVVADARDGRAEAVAGTLGARWAPDVGALLAERLAGLVVATPTASHAELVESAVAAGTPVFCEKPVAETSARTREVAASVDKHGGRVQIGFQRRFDAGYAAARAEVGRGALGRVHTLRGQTCDPAPPPAEYIATSGGIFKDCSVHDFDAIRWVTGREVVSVYAAGTDRGEPFFAAAGDADTAAAVLRLDDDALATVTATRYHGAGYAVTLEVQGTRGTLGAGFDRGLPLRPVGDADPGGAAGTWPPGPPHASFLSRFHDAYVRELQAFVEFARGRIECPCTVGDALEALYIAEACDLSRAENRPVALAEVRP